MFPKSPSSTLQVDSALQCIFNGFLALLMSVSIAGLETWSIVLWLSRRTQFLSATPPSLFCTKMFFLPHGCRKTAENSLRTRGSLLSLLNFVNVLRAQLPVLQGTAALPKLRLKPWTLRQYGCRPQRSHPRNQSRTSPEFHSGEISRPHGPSAAPADSSH